MFVLELKHIPQIVKWCPALETWVSRPTTVVARSHRFFGKGFFFIFWGFLLFGNHVSVTAHAVPVLWSSRVSERLTQVGFAILAIIYLSSGVCYMIAQFTVPGGPVHVTGDDQYADTKAAQTIQRYEGDDSGATSSTPPDPYLSGLQQEP